MVNDNENDSDIHCDNCIKSLKNIGDREVKDELLLSNHVALIWCYFQGKNFESVEAFTLQRIDFVNQQLCIEL